LFSLCCSFLLPCWIYVLACIRCIAIGPCFTSGGWKTKTQKIENRNKIETIPTYLLTQVSRLWNSGFELF
jgi:hypothetical protein